MGNRCEYGYRWVSGEWDVDMWVRSGQRQLLRGFFVEISATNTLAVQNSDDKLTRK